MKIIYCLSILILSSITIEAQYLKEAEDILINDIYPPEEIQQYALIVSNASSTSSFGDFRNWIPYMNSEPLKTPPIKTINITFHIFLDNIGSNNYYSDDQEGEDRITSVFDLLNKIYAGGWAPSDPVSGVTELPDRDTRVRFSLGDNNARIYYYNNTSLNHSWNSSTFDYYIQNNFPERWGQINVYFTAGYMGGRVSESNISITNGGSGYTSAPDIAFVPSGASGYSEIQNGELVNIKITNKGSYSGFVPPKIVISGGEGNGASAIVTKLAGGASGYANLPSNDLSRSHHVVMLGCQNSSWWIDGMCLAHELAHNLGLMHTYCGGGASVVCCSGSCFQGCTQNCGNTEYLSDIFGSCPGTCPHNVGFYDPTSDDPKHTNNVMGGSNSQLYFSPMQAGQMHRSLAIMSTHPTGALLQSVPISEKQLIFMASSKKRDCSETLLAHTLLQYSYKLH